MQGAKYVIQWYKSFLVSAVAQWLRHYATGYNVTGSIPDEDTDFLC
jgi:hypothetical protein